ncbi:hypothetical protein AHiyo6_21370 [Arthrobacter sp. Hiyo6]|nr:hypothetical protein AHiyo6_21370 [Arthrobacter sp. Hiyo6]
MAELSCLAGPYRHGPGVAGNDALVEEQQAYDYAGNEHHEVNGAMLPQAAQKADPASDGS